MPLARLRRGRGCAGSGTRGCRRPAARSTSSAPRSPSSASNVRGVDAADVDARAARLDARASRRAGAAPACRRGRSSAAPSANGSCPSAWSWLPSTAKAPSGASSSASERRRAASPERRARRSPVMTTRSGSAPPDQLDAARRASARSGPAPRRGGRRGARSGGRRAPDRGPSIGTSRTHRLAPTGTRRDPTRHRPRRAPADGLRARSSAAFPSLVQSDMVGRARPRVTRRTRLCGARVTAWQPPAARAQPGAGGSFRRRPPPGWRAFTSCPGTRSRSCTPTTGRAGRARAARTRRSMSAALPSLGGIASCRARPRSASVAARSAPASGPVSTVTPASVRP